MLLINIKEVIITKTAHYYSCYLCKKVILEAEKEGILGLLDKQIFFKNHPDFNQRVKIPLK